MLHRLAPIIDYRNTQRDALLERLLSSYVPERDISVSECTRHLPYFKATKIFDAGAVERQGAMSEYLEDWYTASRREPYFDSHKRGNFFKGYWSWEAAAITVVLDIDDERYREAQFYPRDLVDFAHQAKQTYSPAGLPEVEINELRAKAGDRCPKVGRWQAMDVSSTVREYEQDEPMSDLGSAYGLTIWRFIDAEA